MHQGIVFLFCIILSAASPACLWAGDGIELPDADARCVDEAWMAIRLQMEADLPSWSESDVESQIPWHRAIDSIKESFREVTTSPNRKYKIARFVDKFGKDGPRADFGWLIALGDLGVNFAGGAEYGLYPRRDLTHATIRELQLEVAEAQVRLFMSRRGAVERYYIMLQWGGWMDCGERQYLLLKPATIERMPTDEYWWRARDFLVLHVGTGAPMMADTERQPGQLYKEAIDWSNGLGSLPVKVDSSFPFPDWPVDLAPIPGNVLSGRY